jgi:hypothetical protein
MLDRLTARRLLRRGALAESTLRISAASDTCQRLHSSDVESLIAGSDATAFVLRPPGPRDCVGDIPRPGQGRRRRRRGARFRGGLPAAAEVAHAAPGDRSQTRGVVLREGAALPRLSDTGSQTAGSGAAAPLLAGSDRLASAGRIEVAMACSRSPWVLPAHREMAGLGADRRVWTCKQVRTRTIAPVVSAI